MEKTITLEDFKELFKLKEVSDLFKKTYDSLNFRYKDLEEDEFKETLKKINSLIDADTQKVGASERTEVWFNGWSEPLEEFKKTKSLESIVPKFVRTGDIVKYRQKYIKPEDPYFERNVLKMIQVFLFETYFKEYDDIYDFGCGSGINTVALCKLFPDKHIHSFDFVESAVQLMKEISKECDFDIDAHLFDLTMPNYDIKIKDNSAVFTMGTIEQVPNKFKPFIQYLLANKPKICVHSEPVSEVYDQCHPVDYLAHKFHMKRGYTSGLLPYLRELEQEGKLEILNTVRSTFGSKFFEGYTFIVWRPL